MSTETFIGLNKNKMKMLCWIYGGVGLLSLVLFLSLGELYPSIQLVMRIVGIVIAVFFGVVAGTYLKRYRDQAAGLYFGAKSFIDQASAVSCGEITWKDVTGIKRVEGRELLLIDVKSNEKVLKAAKNRAIGRLLERNVALYGTPVVIDGSALNTNFDELRVIFRRYFERQKGKKIHEN